MPDLQRHKRLPVAAFLSLQAAPSRNDRDGEQFPFFFPKVGNINRKISSQIPIKFPPVASDEVTR